MAFKQAPELGSAKHYKTFRAGNRTIGLYRFPKSGTFTAWFLSTDGSKLGAPISLAEVDPTKDPKVAERAARAWARDPQAAIARIKRHAQKLPGKPAPGRPKKGNPHGATTYEKWEKLSVGTLRKKLRDFEKKAEGDPTSPYWEPVRVLRRILRKKSAPTPKQRALIKKLGG